MPPRKKSAPQVVVDPVAAAAQLGQQLATGEPDSPLPEIPLDAMDLSQDTATGTDTRMLCALGHENAPGARFCAQCGLAMDAPAPVKADPQAARPKPVSELTAEERAARERQHLEAIAAARAFEQAPVTYQPTEGEAVLIHFVDDGFTFAGQVWYRGQELEIGPGHPRWEQAVGWITLTKFQQIERYGKQFFDQGPWPGRRSYLDGADGYEKLGSLDGKGSFAGPGEQALREAEERERRRGRSVPAPLR